MADCESERGTVTYKDWKHARSSASRRHSITIYFQEMRNCWAGRLRGACLRNTNMKSLGIKSGWMRDGKPIDSLVLSPPNFVLSLLPTTTMNTIANEKGSLSDDPRGSGAHGASALSAHTYVHNTTPQLRVLGNPGPL